MNVYLVSDQNTNTKKTMWPRKHEKQEHNLRTIIETTNEEPTVDDVGLVLPENRWTRI